MFGNKKSRSKKSLSKTETGQKKDDGYGWWLFRKKGTAAEPWSTAEDLWNNPQVQKALQNHNELIRKQNRFDR